MTNNQSIFISEAGAYRALAGVILSRGHDMGRGLKRGEIRRIFRRGCFMGYGVVYEGEILKEGV